MHSRGAILAALLTIVFLVAAPGAAGAAEVVLAQPAGGQGDANEDTGDVEEGETESGVDTEQEGTAEQGEDGEAPGGQADPETETGAEEDSAEAATETGPPWTYQMARISLVLLVLLGLAVFRTYHKLVGSRQKGAA
ncbi:MAG TPA: hypothetical protein VG929_00315 [Actinomycetota bacterium]|nr:hypothetical protein [Actinomycetota bacterium]